VAGQDNVNQTGPGAFRWAGGERLDLATQALAGVINPVGVGPDRQPIAGLAAQEVGDALRIGRARVGQPRQEASSVERAAANEVLQARGRALAQRDPHGVGQDGGLFGKMALDHRSQHRVAERIRRARVVVAIGQIDRVAQGRGEMHLTAARREEGLRCGAAKPGRHADRVEHGHQRGAHRSAEAGRGFGDLEAESVRAGRVCLQARSAGKP
jgi:hypothetical protein